MDLTLFEATRDPQDQSGVFVLYLPADTVPKGDHIDRILSLLNIQIADRRGIRKSYEDFVHTLPTNQFVKFKASLVVEHPHVSLRESGGVDIATTRRVLKFSEVEAWDTKGICPTLCDLTHHFDLPSLSTVTPSHPTSTIPYSFDILEERTVLGY